MHSDPYAPHPEHKFSFGLWTVGNRGRDPFGDAVRPPVKPGDLVRLLGEVGAWGVNLHDNDLVPIDASSADRNQIVRDFKRPAPTKASSHRWSAPIYFLIPCFGMGP